MFENETEKAFAERLVEAGFDRFGGCFSDALYCGTFKTVEDQGNGRFVVWLRGRGDLPYGPATAEAKAELHEAARSIGYRVESMEDFSTWKCTLSPL